MYQRQQAPTSTMASLEPPRRARPITNWLPLHLELLDDTTTKRLRLSCTKVGKDVVRTVSKSLQNNTALEDLWLDGDLLDIDVALTLASSLRKNNTLKKLRIRGARLAGTGASALFDSLRENTGLEEFY
jgi:hypothetical protein